MLTWEFPPYYTGGLGTACKGMVRALLAGKGIVIYLFLPSEKPAFFVFTRPEDTERLKPISLSVDKGIKEQPERPEVFTGYYNPELRNRDKLPAARPQGQSEEISSLADAIQSALVGDEPIFRMARMYSQMLRSHGMKLDYDVVHAHDWVTFPAAVSLGASSGKPVILHIHSTEYDRAVGRGDARIHRIEELGLRAADRVIAVSKRTRRQLIRNYRGIDGEKISVVYNGIESGEWKRSGRADRNPVVVFLGRLERQKAPDYFIETARLVGKEIAGVKFVVAGQGSEEGRLQQVSGGVSFTGFLNRERVRELLARSDILLLPSRREPFGLVALEAMAAGVVPVVPANSGVAEILRNAIKTEMKNPGETARIIIGLLKEPDKLAELRGKCIEEAGEHEWSRRVGKIVRVYREEIDRMRR